MRLGHKCGGADVAPFFLIARKEDKVKRRAGRHGSNFSEAGRGGETGALKMVRGRSTLDINVNNFPPGPQTNVCEIAHNISNNGKQHFVS